MKNAKVDGGDEYCIGVQGEEPEWALSHPITSSSYLARQTIANDKDDAGGGNASISVLGWEMTLRRVVSLQKRIDGRMENFGIANLRRHIMNT